MFHLYQGNDLNRLAGRLARILKETDDPLAREVVAVPNPALGRWLMLRIADVNGFCPDIDLPLPGRFLYQEIFNPLQGVEGQRDISSFLPEVNRWRIHALLGTLKSERVDRFVSGDVRKRWQLAGRMAELFDSYMTCRQEMLEDWQIAHPDRDWQKQLWEDLSRDRTDSFAALCRRFLSVRTFKPGNRRYFCFAVSTLPAVHLDCILKLAQTTEVHFFMFNPCCELWDDAVARKWSAEETDSGFPVCNALLGNNGRLGRDFLRMMLDKTEWNTEELFVRDRTPGTLLTAIQKDIEENREPDGPLLPADGSVSVQVCHSPMRETEVLYDCILKAFADFKDLKPGDVRVVVPDLETYAPYIDAVFGVQPNFPFEIAEKPGRGLHPEYRAFETLLKLPGSKYKTSEVMPLFTCEAFRRKFGLSESDVEILTELLRNAGVAWGLTESSREAMDEKYLYSWRFAFDRLVFGEVMNPSDRPVEMNGKICYPEFSAENRHEIVGALGEILDGLETFDAKIREGDRSFEQWIDLLRETAAVFFDDTQAVLAGVLSEVERSFPPEGVAGQTFPFEIIRAVLLERFEAGVVSGNPVSGRIVFCRFQTFGGAPARVIGLLGMNDGIFPRRDDRVGFDLAALTFERGDRSKRLEDRFAFLQTLLAARDRLIVTYTGRSEKDNSEIPPSLVVGELLDSIRQYTGEEKTVVTEHPLHPFSPKYFQGNGPVTYSQSYYKLARQIGGSFEFPPVDPVEVPAVETVSLDELVGFLADPVGSFERNTLGANAGQNRNPDLPDEEPFEISALDRYLFVEELLKNPDPENFWKRNYGSGRLPYNPVEVRQEVEGAAEAIREKLERLGAGKLLPPQPVRIPVGGFEIVGTLTGLRENGFQIVARPAKAKLKDLIRLAICHLAAERNRRTCGIYSDAVVEVGTLADVSFEAILELYQIGRTRPIYFSEDETALAAFLDGTTPEDFRMLRHFGAVPDSDSIDSARKFAELVGKIAQGVSK